MGIIDSAKRLVGRGPDGEEETLYRCLTCQSEFEGPEQRATEVSCPDCGANAVQKEYQRTP